MQAWRVPEISRLPGSGGTVSVHDTAREAVVPVGPASGTARMYVCGITPYDATHLGHANTYLAFDLLNRSWRDAGLAVDYVQNVTDVDDPLLERATETGVDWRELAAEQTELFRTDMAALNVLPPDHLVGAVESMELVAGLIERLRGVDGAIYPVDDAEHPDLYFARAADGRFGSLSKLGAEATELFAERGGDPDRAGKKDPLDCLVWRLERPGEPSWASPFGPGRPGWHIECTAIALDLLGPEFDVQGGGRDLIFPHHEMCASEGRVATGREFAKAYVHSGMVALDGEKMSKSKGNLELVSRLRAQGADPMAIRLALLSQHYREDWSWTPDLLTEATGRLDQWREAARRDAGVGSAETLAAVRAALRNDLDAPAAVAAIDAWAGATLTIDGDDSEAPALIAAITDALLGIKL